MKYLIRILFALLFSTSAFATNLCDTSCDIVFIFPDGGSIEAIDTLTIDFGTSGGLELGETGTVNTNPQPISTDFSSGGSLTLNSGDSITFDSNGWIKVGTGGNIVYSSISINTSGDISITAVDGTNSIEIENVTLSGEGHVLLDAATISVTGNLTLEPGGTLSVIADTGSLETTTYSIQDNNNNVTLSTGTLINSTSTLSVVATELNVSPGLITEASLSILNINLDTTVINNTVGPISFEAITQAILESFDDGISLPTEDGNSCTMSGGECLSATGQKYVVVDGKLVSEKSGSGVMNPIDLIFLLLLIALVNNYKMRRVCRAHQFPIL